MEYLTLPMTSRARCHFFSGGLLRSTSVMKGVLYTYSFRAIVRLILRRPRDSRIGALKTPALEGERGGCPRPPAIYFAAASSDLRE